MCNFAAPRCLERRRWVQRLAALRRSEAVVNVISPGIFFPRSKLTCGAMLMPRYPEPS
jgi:hypothetical protein